MLRPAAVIFCFLLAVPAFAQPAPAAAPTRAAEAAIAKPRSSWASQEARPVIESGLAWLARHQEKDGSWSPSAFSSLCAGDAVCDGPGYDENRVGITALAALACLGYGAAPGKPLLLKDEVLGSTPDIAESLARALRWLRVQQQADGGIGTNVGSKSTYVHAIAAYALGEAYALTGDPDLRLSAKKAVDWLVRAQNPGKGWRYSSRCGESDTSVTGWCIAALYTARLAGLAVPADAFQGARKYLEGATNAQFMTGYTRMEDAGVKVMTPGKNDEFGGHPTMSAIALFARHLIDGPKLDPRHRQAVAKLLADDPPRWDPAKRTIDYYYWYHAAEAMHQAAGSPAAAKAWEKSLLAALTLGQGRDKKLCTHGSWSADTKNGYGRWAFEGGRVYATAISLLALETPIRYGPLPPIASLTEGETSEADYPAAAPLPLTAEERGQLEDWTAGIGGPASPASEAAILRFGPRAAEVLRTRLRDPDASVRRKVRELLTRLLPEGSAADDPSAPAAPDPSAPPEYAVPNTSHMARYRDDLKSPDITVRERAVGALTTLKSTYAVDALVAALQAEEQGALQARIVNALLQTERAAVLREVRKATNAKPTPAEARGLLEFLARCEDADAQRSAVLIFLGPDPDIAAAAKKVLRSNRKTSLPVIVEATRACQGAARTSLVELQGEFGDKRAVPFLCSLCPSEPEINPERETARTALRRIGLVGVPALIDALNTTNRKYVVIVLREITGAAFGVDSIDKWKGWLKENKDRIDDAERERFPDDPR